MRGGPVGGWAARAAGLRAGKGEREREEGVGVLFFSFFQTFEIELFSNFSRFLKHFKASRQQTKTSCIQIMMHKHLLLLNY
jgi:hypothetical protein